ncbi:unnamed protein product [Pleuronectes platessa]|uniref:Uncharacterized protein n=1 Tax=Pleuronectes platessa TaxID=8262 RepID=A0A9N7TT68_PLEPL|nr:unnamed protein product [Pleuronectes platessa]
MVVNILFASPRPLRVCLSTDSAAVLGTGVLNQPQVADKRIWIESRRAPLPAAASRRCRCRSRAGYTVIGFMSHLRSSSVMNSHAGLNLFMNAKILAGEEMSQNSEK